MLGKIKNLVVAEALAHDMFRHDKMQAVSFADLMDQPDYSAAPRFLRCRALA